ncbi:hypothetical protein BU14_0058s0049 [Porphyra umbilicalis]|uniref:Uncharacterized protein n=1 Tax=Porphyra umbilicalis TaxID=2786 RepID=A0A1X6PHE1_PORUM|nr:hypothetical protein BU14_0058s0049 [Porphyra umbilicalis]|eukprot:OSX80138.1 hypothetical protein BU14_0058s0049 [Porphyra umbilicalis]
MLHLPPTLQGHIHSHLRPLPPPQHDASTHCPQEAEDAHTRSQRNGPSTCPTTGGKQSIHDDLRRRVQDQLPRDVVLVCSQEYGSRKSLLAVALHTHTRHSRHHLSHLRGRKEAKSRDGQFHTHLLSRSGITIATPDTAVVRLTIGVVGGGRVVRPTRNCRNVRGGVTPTVRTHITSTTRSSFNTPSNTRTCSSSNPTRRRVRCRVEVPVHCNGNPAAMECVSRQVLLLYDHGSRWLLLDGGRHGALGRRRWLNPGSKRCARRRPRSGTLHNGCGRCRHRGGRAEAGSRGVHGAVAGVPYGASTSL